MTEQNKAKETAQMIMGVFFGVVILARVAMWLWG